MIFLFLFKAPTSCDGMVCMWRSHKLRRHSTLTLKIYFDWKRGRRRRHTLWVLSICFSSYIRFSSSCVLRETRCTNRETNIEDIKEREKWFESWIHIAMWASWTSTNLVSKESFFRSATNVAQAIFKLNFNACQCLADANFAETACTRLLYENTASLAISLPFITTDVVDLYPRGKIK